MEKKRLGMDLLTAQPSVLEISGVNRKIFYENPQGSRTVRLGVGGMLGAVGCCGAQ